MLRKTGFAILLSLLFCAAPRALWAADTEPEPPAATLLIGGQQVAPWQPGESFPGGSQYDPRLDKPVQFWRAGIPLREVFAELARQTGVGFDFLPGGTDDPRMSVTLYLNPQQPPTLREVMAQLSWVTGNLFAYAEPRIEERTYYLLSTSLGQGVAEKLAAQAAAQREQFRTQWQARRDSDRKTAGAVLAEARNALSLSQDEAIARYHGVNDSLLLNLLDPSRRAALSLLSDLPEDDTKQLLGSDRPMLTRAWSDWSPDQQAALKQALGSNRNWPADSKVTILVTAGMGGSIMALDASGQRRRPVGRLGGLLSSGNVRGREDIALRRYLGELKTPEEEAAARQQQRQAQQANRAARQEQWTEQRKEVEEATRSLFPAREALLASLSLYEPEQSSLWQLQETVAKATGMNVVSDCFAPPRGGFGGFGGFGRRRGGQAQPAKVSALDALSAACAAGGGGFGGFGGFGGGPGGRGGRAGGPGAAGGAGGRGGPAGPGGAPAGGPGAGGGPGGPGGPGAFGGGGTEDLSVQWGDAGTFLRFRSRHPEIWRAALLPVSVQTRLDTWLAPTVTAAPSAEAAGAGGRFGLAAPTSLTGDLTKMTWLASQLNDVQLRLGGAIPYEDPADPKGSRLQALRRATLLWAMMGAPLYRFLGTFSAKQWELVKGDGLRWGYDLMPDQQSADVSRMFTWAVPENRVNDVVLKLGQTESRTVPGPGGTDRTIPPAPALTVSLDGEQVSQLPLGPMWGGGFGGRGGRGANRAQGGGPGAQAN